MTMQSKAAKKATARKARAMLGLLDQPGACLILAGREDTYILAGRQHIYLCGAIFDYLRAQGWVSPPNELRSGLAECSITPQGHGMLNFWRHAGGAGYTQLLFEEIEDFIKIEAQQKAEAEQKARAATIAAKAGYQASLFDAQEPEEPTTAQPPEPAEPPQQAQPAAPLAPTETEQTEQQL